ncbi:MAG TPA: hypothetical protein VJO33_05115 [Gemmatimonadaceae bacterium]|nr:hypothetical protein [Gemmatimonadaceae bacterium]
MGTTNLPALVTSHSPTRYHAVSQLRDALRRVWASAKKPQRDEEVTSVAKGVLTTERYKGLEHIVAMQFDAIERDAPIAMVEEFWTLGATIARAKHAALTGEDPLQGVSLGHLLEAERRAHAERETALALFLSDNRSYRAAQRLFDATSAYDVTNKLLMEYWRRRAADCEWSNLSLSSGPL